MLSNILDDLDDTNFVCQSQNDPKKRVRKLQEKWTSEQTASLIQEVESREGTWNFLSREYRDRNLREALWQEVADVLKMPRSEVATKWNSLRCSFRAMFNKIGQTKSGQAAGKTTPTNPLYNSLKFLEPTLQIQAPTTSNYANDSLLSSPGSPHGAEAYSDLDDSQPTARRAAVKRCAVKNEDEYSKVVKHALQTMAECTKSDAWSDVGDFVASNGRLWATEKPQLANNFKTDIYELVLNYQKKATRYVLKCSIKYAVRQQILYALGIKIN